MVLSKNKSHLGADVKDSSVEQVMSAFFGCVLIVGIGWLLFSPPVVQGMIWLNYSIFRALGIVKLLGELWFMPMKKPVKGSAWDPIIISYVMRTADVAGVSAFVTLACAPPIVAPYLATINALVAVTAAIVIYRRREGRKRPSA